MAGCSGGDGGKVGNPPLPIPTASFAVSSSSVDEGSGIEVQVTLSSPAPGIVVIPFTLTGTALRNADYTSAVSPLRIPYGSSSGTIYIGATDDWGDESDETVIVTLGEPTHATLGDIVTTTVFIRDTDEPTVMGRVTESVSGTAVAGATARVGMTTTTTDDGGKYMLLGFPGAPSVRVDFAAEGYAPQGRVIGSIAMANAALNVPMVPVAATHSFATAQPVTLTVPNSPAQVVLAASSLERVGGGAPAGDVTAQVTPLPPASNLDVMPGNYVDISFAPFETYGALDVRFTDTAGAPLDLAGGQFATLRIPASARGALPPTVSLFYYDAVAGFWRQQGTATLAGAAPNQYYQGTVTRAGTWSAAAFYSATVAVTGCVQDASGARIPEAIVTVEATTYASKLSALTDADGNFTLPMKASSTAFLQAVKDNAVSNSPRIQTSTGNLAVTPCLMLSSTNLSIKLTWGERPLDLDSHTLGANADQHVFYASPGSLTEQPYIALDVDDTTGLGPEVTTFSRLARNRRYSFYVHNFSNTFDPGQTRSPARVEITSGGTQRVFTPPSGETELTRYWHVFDLTTNQQCLVTVVPVQRFTVAEPVQQNVGNDAVYCE